MRKIANMLPSLVAKTPHRLLEDKFISLLQSCKTLKLLHQIHSQIINNGFQHEDHITPKIITGCALFNKMEYAHKLFDQIPDPDASVWNAMFRGYSQNESHKEVIILFRQMKGLDVMPDCFTFPVVLKSCVKINALKEGEELHCFLIKSGFRADRFVATALIGMYASGGAISAAYRVFGEMMERNVIAWTTMINGYITCCDLVTARRLFDLAPVRDIVLWNTMISGYIETGDVVRARELFNKMPNKDVISWNTVLNGYASNGDVMACVRLFEEMPERNVFSWNTLIGRYTCNGYFSEALSAFKKMLLDGNVVPNDVTLVNVLSACSRLGALDFGKWVHVYAESHGYKENIYVANALMDMYAKCGVVETAFNVFKSMNKKDLISWNTIIGGLAVHGRGADALNLFSQMRSAGENPDGITFICILCACTHVGLVEDGLSYFKSMTDDYSIVPQIEHYGCIVDLLGRAGHLAEAMYFVRKMPIEAHAVIWTTLLGACRAYKNVELAELALGKLIEFEPKNPANFVMLSNIYGDFGRWKDVARLKVAMRDTGFKKLPGCSLIEVNDDVVEFYSMDERHPEKGQIYGTLRALTKLLRSTGYVPDFTELDERN